MYMDSVVYLQIERAHRVKDTELKKSTKIYALRTHESNSLVDLSLYEPLIIVINLRLYIQLRES